jgi:hypothetical protein
VAQTTGAGTGSLNLTRVCIAEVLKPVTGALGEEGVWGEDVKRGIGAGGIVDLRGLSAVIDTVRSTN